MNYLNKILQFWYFENKYVRIMYSSKSTHEKGIGGLHNKECDDYPKGLKSLNIFTH